MRCSDLIGSCDAHVTTCEAPQVRYNSHVVRPHLFSTVCSTSIGISPEEQPPEDQLPEDQLPAEELPEDLGTWGMMIM